MKEIMKSTGISVGISTFIFCVIGVIYDLVFDGNFSLANYGFTKMVIGCMLVGMGFGIPSVVYQREALPRPIQVTIHMGSGCVIYTLVAFAVGWIPAGLGLANCLLLAAAQLTAAFVIWLLFMRYYRKEALKINRKIREMS